MRKLKQAYVVEIIRRLNLGNRGAYGIGRRFGVSARRVRQLQQEYVETGEVPKLGRPGPKAKELPEEVKKIVEEEWKENPVGALTLERILEKKRFLSVSHNKIHEILLETGLSKPNLRKSKRRKWVRFERKKSNSLWQIDWTRLKDKWVIAIMDDASRFVVGHGEFTSATAGHSVEVLERAIAQHGKPKQLLSGRDCQFISSVKDADRESHLFQKAINQYEIKHILARVSHPQTCGKIERFFGEMKGKWRHFGSVDGFVDWYNNRRPHMSLNWDELETPAQAFLRKRPKSERGIEVLVVR